MTFRQKSTKELGRIEDERNLDVALAYSKEVADELERVRAHIASLKENEGTVTQEQELEERNLHYHKVYVKSVVEQIEVILGIKKV